MKFEMERVGVDQIETGESFDLIMKGGEVLDPSQDLRARRDIGIKKGLIAGLAPDIPPDRGARVIEARGKLVTPGLVDLHAHVYPRGSPIGLSADEIAPATAKMKSHDPDVRFLICTLWIPVSSRGLESRGFFSIR